MSTPRRWLRHPITWAGILGAALMGSVMTFSYIGGLVDPVGHMHGAPIGFVNADNGTTVGTAQIDLGQQIQDKVTGTKADQLSWKVLDSQAVAERQLRDNELWGAVVVPESFSADVAQIAARTGDAPQAKLQVLTNEGSGIFQPAIFEQLADAAVAQTSTEVAQQLTALLDQAQATVAPSHAASVGQPVVADVQPVVQLPEKAGRGIAPFYLAVMVTLTGFLAASIVNIAVDLLRGVERLELFGRELNFRVGEGRPWPTWLVKAGGTLLGGGLGGLLAAVTAVNILGMDVSSTGKAIGWAVLGAVTVGMITLVFLTLFGIAGELLGVLFTTIFGVPAALGIYPSQAIPGFFDFLAGWHPMRYLSDGMRSIAFYDASGAGLGRAVTIIVIWLAGAVLVGALAAWLLDRRARSVAPNGSPAVAMEAGR